MNEVSLGMIRFDDRGLVPAIVQDAETGRVLMLAYMNRESLQRTLESGETHFWSRQRREIWHKGETSGHVQKVRNVRVDCDSDALLIAVEQKGNACHTGELSCFFTSLHAQATPVATLGEVLGKLRNVIQERHSEMPEGSYTAKLFAGGTDRILKKIGEEAGEVIIAAKNHRKEEIVWEVADLLYHTLVLLQHESIATSDIAAELERRSAKM